MGLYKRSKEAGSPWWYRFYVSGKEIRGTTGTSDRREASRIERALRAKYEAEAPKRVSRGTITLADLAGLDVERAIARGADPGTRTRTLEHMWANVIKRMGDMEAARIREQHIETYIIERRKGGVSTATIKREVGCLKRGLQLAKRRGLLILLPDFPDAGRAGEPGRGRGKLHEVSVLRRWMEALEGEAQAEAALCLLTGLRKEELHRICPSWVRPAPPGLGVPAVLEIPGPAAKNRKARVVGLPALSYAIVMEYGRDKAPDAPIFSGAAHRTAWRLAARRIGYTQTISYRDLRHTHSTLAMQALGDPTAPMGALGHSQLATTQRYLTAPLARIVACSEAVAGILEEP